MVINDNISEWMDTFAAIPAATIVLIFIFLTLRLITNFTTKTIEMLSQANKEQTLLLTDTIKIIKQIERNKQ